MHGKIEVLSPFYEHLYYVDWTDAISNVFIGRAEVVEEHEDKVIGTSSGQLPLPMVVRFKSGPSVTKFHNKHSTKFTRDTLFDRDKNFCQYCMKKLSREQATIDHVIPRCMGGETSWENCVTCCGRCNLQKGGRTLTQSGMSLSNTPGRPTSHQIRGIKR